MLRAGAWLLLSIVTPCAAFAAGNVHMDAGFETGKFQPKLGDIDAFVVVTLPDPQIGNEVIVTGTRQDKLQLPSLFCVLANLSKDRDAKLPV